MMCGYCIEGGVTLSVVLDEYQGRDFEMDGLVALSYLQECDDLSEGINRAALVEEKNQFMTDVAVCRLYEHYIKSGFDLALFAQIFRKLEQGSVANLIGDLGSNCRSGLCAELGEPDIYTRKLEWQQFIQNRDELVDKSKKVLEDYCGWWLDGYLEKAIKGRNSLAGDCSIDDTHLFYSVFPAVYFSLMFLSKYQPDAPIIEKIALGGLRNTPGFNGNELWLQRRAVLHCVERDGVQFILEHYDELRFEVICIVLLKGTLSRSELERLRDFVLSNTEHSVINIDHETVIEVIGAILQNME